MAELTPNDFLKIAEPLEQIYTNAVSALLINIARHFRDEKTTPIADWEIQKLAELGAVTRESAQIIADITGNSLEEIEKALREAVRAATIDVEPALKKGLEAGALEAPAANDVLVSDGIRQAIEAYKIQLGDSLSRVNSTMLQSTIDVYRKVVANTAALEAAMQSTQEALVTEAGNVVLGVKSREKALRDSLMQIQKEGITGFYDRAGRKWSPEAYVNMDIRTTVHNAAIDSIRIRQEDYGADIFRVSKHSGARPLCYPYQGKYYSWNGKSGMFTDGNGKRHRYRPISSTSYGKPAGLFGIQCRHHPITVIPGVSGPQKMKIENAEENRRIYAESQQQRSLERDIRYAKQRALMLEAAGDKEGFEQEAQTIKAAQSRYNAFCKETGRTKRTDRTQVEGYTVSTSRKVSVAGKR